MFDALETGFGLDIILWLQSIRLPFLDALVQILDVFGEELFYIAIIALIYWVFNKSLGTRLVFVLIIASITTSFAKDIFATERPYEVSDSVNELVQEDTYGIPSGHVLISMAVWGYLAYALKRRWLTALIIVYILLQSLGRMLGGVHYPQDVLGGWIFGGLILALAIGYGDKVANFWNNASSSQKGIAMLVSVIAASLLVVVASWKNLENPLLLSLPAQVALPEPCPTGAEGIDAACFKHPHFDTYFTNIGLLLGAFIGVWLEARFVGFKPHSQVWRRALQYIIGLTLSIFLLTALGAVVNAIAETGLLANILRVLRYASLTVFALALWPWFSLKFGLMEKVENAKAVS